MVRTSGFHPDNRGSIPLGDVKTDCNFELQSVFFYLFTMSAINIDTEQLSQLLQKGGSLDSQVDYFEQRDAQIRLLKEVSNAFNTNRVAVLEAATGVGKSFAYLLPALSWVHNNSEERVVISTGTINLQQQLFEKDIPQALKFTGISVKALLLKGRQNYLCKRRLQDLINEKDLFSDEIEELDRLVAWANETDSGDKSSIPFMVKESFWQRVQSESDACLGTKCPYYESCFVMKLRKEANDSQILIVNHHLLFADIETRLNGLPFDENGVLPAYTRLIFDEAHGIEDSATSFFSSSLNRFVILKQLALLARSRKSSQTGLLFSLDVLSESEDSLQEALVKMQEIKVFLTEFETACLNLLQRSFTFRFTKANIAQTKEFFKRLEVLQQSLHGFLKALRNLIQGIDEDNESLPVVWEAKQISKRLEFMAETCDAFLTWEKEDEYVFWIEKRRLNFSQAKNDLFSNQDAQEYPVIHKTPLSIAKTMNKGVFEQFETVICTSATLQTSSGFSFWLNRIGANFLSKERLVCEAFASNFDYKNNAAFAIPQDIPLPDSPLFQDSIEKALIRLIQASQGRALVLFTSFESLRSAAYTLRNTKSLLDFPILVQGEIDRFKLLNQFKEEKNSVLLATSSFWEGVDVPGESLSHVIIVKLPFSVPSDPVFAARSEAIEKEGRSSFAELSLPSAIIAFRQGFGRLMRRNTDRGVITVLDRRLLVKNYGRQFLSSLPQTKNFFSPLDKMVLEIKDFLK